ncbi:MAG: M14 family metallopeptidase [Saprospiraceae bacterium]
MTSQLYESYEQFREPTITKRRIKHQDIQPLIKKMEGVPGFEVREVGKSIQGRSLSLISVGTGPIDVFLWSQMHGDESTATMAIFDIFNFLKSDVFQKEKGALLKKVRIHFLPMLNPDGAEEFKRRNALGVDLNRDALRLQSPESRTLKAVRDSLDADFGFNLHDQSRYYNAYRTEKTATISYLAPAYNYEKSVNEVRSNAMKVIVMMNRIIQKYAPGQVGSYNDTFEPRAFGDNLQKWGTSTILIESGGYPGDREKQEIRKLNYVSILSAIFSIGDASYKNAPLSEYNKIPGNDRKLYDLKIEKVNYPLYGKYYQLDLGINYYEVELPGTREFYLRGGVADQGDLSNFYGYKEFDGSAYQMQFGAIYSKTFPNMKALEQVDFQDLLAQGYTHVKVADMGDTPWSTDYPIIIVDTSYRIAPPEPGAVPSTFLLKKDGQIEYALINGFLYNLKTGENQVENGLIFRRR